MITFTKTGNSIKMDIGGTDITYLPPDTSIFVKVNEGKIYLQSTSNTFLVKSYISFLPTDVNGRPNDDLEDVAEWLRDDYFSGLTLQATGDIDLGDVTVINGTGANAVNVRDGGNSLTVDGAISITDGVTSVEVVPLAGYNAQAVAIVDGSGNQITSFGGGTQYTEGDVDASITGSAMMMEVAGNTVQPIQGTVADGLLVNLGSNNDVRITDGAGTVNTKALGVQIVTGDIGLVTNTIIHGLSTGGGGNYVDVKVNPSGALSVAATLEAGTNNIGDVDILSIAAGDNNIGNVDIVTMPNVVIGSGTVTSVTSVTNPVAVTQSGTWDEVGINDSGNSITVDAPVGTPVFVRLSDGVSAITTLPVSLATNTPTLQANSGVDIGDVTINNAGGAAAVNIQDGGNTITVDGTVTANATLAAETTKVIGTVNIAAAQTIAVTNAGTFAVQQTTYSSSSVTQVSSSATSVQLLASTVGRKGAYFFNDSTAIAYLKLGTTAATNSYTIKMAAGSFYELPYPCYTGRIDCIWASANGVMAITEIS